MGAGVRSSGGVLSWLRYLLKARRAYFRRQGPTAVAHFVRALALARFLYGDRHWRTLRCQVLLARAYLDLQDLPAQADEHASEALTTILMYQGTELIPDGKSQVLHMQLLARLVRGQALVQLGQPAAAEDCLRKAADLLATWGENSAEHLDAEHAVLRAEGRLAGSDPAALSAGLSGLHQRCLTRLGAAHVTTIKVADHLIQVHVEQQYHEKATRECRANTKAKVETHGELSREVADSLRSLSQLYVTSGQLERAVEVSRRCWAIENLMFGRQDKRVQAAEEAFRELERRLGRGSRYAGRVRSAASTATPSIDDALRL
ncbi:tetratricopeptide repeat protein 23-like [Pollicipes pollicipes]|uniref:tetratricopeptide repeat protein 23-like n=1 Tax=Pollicipes pollicipes TaxID=41117 RepID=UPI001884A076|nr:tetratricopeptide repeat protein 23-like [Pollicipes pollicipes]